MIGFAYSLTPPNRARAGALDSSKSRGLFCVAVPARLSSSRQPMIARLLTFTICLVLTGCVPKPPNFVDAADPALIIKLGISTQDWSDIQRLVSQEKGFVIKDAAKVGPEVIEVELKKPDDTKNDQGGPADRIQKKEGHWIRQTDWDGWWAVGR